MSLVGGGVRKKPGWRPKSGRSGVGRGGGKGLWILFVLVCVWVEIWILKSVEKMGGAIPGMGKNFSLWYSALVRFKDGGSFDVLLK